MGTNRSLKSGFDVAQQHVPVPILVIAGPLLGLGYIIVLPFIGIAASIASEQIARADSNRSTLL